MSQEDSDRCAHVSHAKATDMTTVQQHVVDRTKECRRAHVSVVTAAVAAALISAAAVLVTGSKPSTLLSAPRHAAVTMDTRAPEAPVMPQPPASRTCAGTPASKHEFE